MSVSLSGGDSLRARRVAIGRSAIGDGSAGGAGGRIDRVVCDTATSGLWNEYIQRYHYLGYTPMSGSQLRYKVFAGERLVALLSFGESLDGRGERIRTFDPLVPNQMRYQAALHPDEPAF